MKKKKRPLSLLEIMIVIFIIGIIGGVIAFNMRGSLEEGKAFKSKEAISRLYSIFQIEIAREGEDIIDKIIEDPVLIVRNSGLAPKPKDLVKDGWGKTFEFSKNAEGNDVRIHSPPYVQYCEKKKVEPVYPWEE